MSTQVIEKRGIPEYASYFSEITRKNADRYFMHNKLRVGENINYLEAMYYNRMHKIFCSDTTCQLVDYIKLKLEGKLEELGVKKDTNYSVDNGIDYKNQRLQYLLQQLQNQTSCTTQTDCINICCQEIS
jgi:hypothetical protein